MVPMETQIKETEEKAYRPKSSCMIKVVFLIVWKGRPSQEIITVNIN